MNELFSLDTIHNYRNTSGGAFTLFVLFIMFQYIFKMDFVCPCDYNRVFCGLYVLLPSVTVTLIMLIVPRYKCKRKQIVRSLLIGLVWVISAFIDGGVVVCFFANVTAGRQDECVDVNGQSPDQQRTINFYVNLSRASVLGVILIISIIFAVYNCCEKKQNNDPPCGIVKLIYDSAAVEAERVAQQERETQPHGRDDSQMDRGGTQNPSNPESNPPDSPHSDTIWHR